MSAVFFLPGHVLPRQAFGETASYPGGSPAPELEYTYYCKPCGDRVRLVRQDRWLCCPRCGDKKMTDGSTGKARPDFAGLTGAGSR